MVRPSNFWFNEESAETNRFQNNTMPLEESQQKALKEFDWFKNILESHWVDVIIVQDSEIPVKPDAIFPNNRISTYNDGKVVLHPMKNTNRSLERSNDVIGELTSKYWYIVSEILSLTHHEEKGKALEWTGSLLLDRVNKVAYVALSPRSDEKVLDQYCDIVWYEKIQFNAINPLVKDWDDKRIYHTNVMYRRWFCSNLFR